MRVVSKAIAMNKKKTWKRSEEAAVQIEKSTGYYYIWY